MYFLPTSYQNLKCRLMVVEELENFIRVFISKYQSMQVICIVFFLQYVLMMQAHLSVIFQIILNRVLNILLGWLRQVKFDEAKQFFFITQRPHYALVMLISPKNRFPIAETIFQDHIFFVQKFGTRCFSGFFKSKLVPGRKLFLFFPFSLHFPNFPFSILMAAQCIRRGTLQQQSPLTKTHRGLSGAIVSFLGFCHKIFVVDISGGLGE